MADDQVRPDGDMRLARLERHRRHARCCSKARLRSCVDARAPPVVLYSILRIPAASAGGFCETNMRAQPPLFHQVAGNVAELGGEVLVDEEDVHRESRNLTASAGR
jgi:hypothetical protein